MHLEANVKSEFSNLFLKHFPKNTILIRTSNYLLAKTVYFIFEGKKKDPSVHSRKTDCHMTSIWSQDVDNPTTCFLFKLRFVVRREKKRKNQKCHTHNWKGGEGDIWNMVGVRMHGPGEKKRHESRLLIGQELDSSNSREERKNWKLD